MVGEGLKSWRLPYKAEHSCRGVEGLRNIGYRTVEEAKTKARCLKPLLLDRIRDEKQKWTRIFERRLVGFQVDIWMVDTVCRGVRGESLKLLGC